MSKQERTARVLLIAGFLVGFALKVVMLFYMGVFDMDAYYDWGKRALELGLPASYHGIYFPLQYQIFEVCAWLVPRLGLQFFTVFKIANLAFDLASFVVLLALLKRHGLNPLYALTYWIHPWFLAVFSLGYVDFQFTFFILLSIWLLRSASTMNYLPAGFALGCAFLMKPQTQILIIAAFVYCLLRYVRSKETRSFAILAGPTFLFLCYEVWFGSAHTSATTLARAAVLPLSYLDISNVMPALTAQMTNIWYPIGYLLKASGQPVLSVSDQIQVLPGISVKYIAAAFVLSLVAIQVWRIERADTLDAGERFALIFGFAALVVPFFMTSGHENHLFLGTVLLVPLVARAASGRTLIAFHLLLLVQFLHIYSLYGNQPARLAELLRRTQSDELAVIYSLIALGCFALLLKPLSPSTRASDLR